MLFTFGCMYSFNFLGMQSDKKKQPLSFCKNKR